MVAALLPRAPRPLVDEPPPRRRPLPSPDDGLRLRSSRTLDDPLVAPVVLDDDDDVRERHVPPDDDDDELLDDDEDVLLLRRLSP